MQLFKINNLTKKFSSGNGREKTILNNVSFSFPNRGLFLVVGKSGSGKSTFLNMISLMDKPTSGSIVFNGQEINKWTSKRINEYRNHDIGFIFQHYHLLENETVLFNVMLPLLINGKSLKESEIVAKEKLKSIGFKEGLFNHKCKDLSGGEKEKIAILRAIINNPKVVFADEPTGALDTRNSLLVMKILKEISKERLVIVVTHNLSLAEKFADSIISIKDGRIKEIKKGFIKDGVPSPEIKKKTAKNNQWCISLMKSNFKRRFRRNIISLAGLVIGLVSSMLIIGFSLGSEQSIKEKSYHQFNYGVASLYKETKQTIPGSKMSLVQMNRLSLDEINSLKTTLTDFEIEPNTDALFTPIASIGENKLDDLVFQPIYSFSGSYVDRSFLLYGEIPFFDDDSFVVINKTAYSSLKRKMYVDPLGLKIHIHSDYEFHYYTNDSFKPVIVDYFIYDKTVEVVGVVDDFGFLSTPMAYYSYISFKNFLIDSLAINLSEYLNKPVNWLDCINQSDDSNPINSYSNRAFLKDINNKEKIEVYISNLSEPYKMESSSILIANTLFDLMHAATIGMSLFLVIALTGTALIMGILAFSSYSEDKKTSAILKSLGADNSDIFSIYIYENLALGGIGLLVSLILAPIFSLIINKIVVSISGFQNIISIPFMRFMNRPLLFPMMIIVFTLLVCVISTFVPLMFSKRISPREELAEE